MKSVEKDVWVSFEDVTQNFLGNYKDPNYATIVEKSFNTFNNMSCIMSLKIHFLHFHLEYFERQHATESNKQGERYHQVSLVF